MRSWRTLRFGLGEGIVDDIENQRGKSVPHAFIAQQLFGHGVVAVKGADNRFVHYVAEIAERKLGFAVVLRLLR